MMDGALLKDVFKATGGQRIAGQSFGMVQGYGGGTLRVARRFISILKLGLHKLILGLHNSKLGLHMQPQLDIKIHR